jgi:hypothetical protein
VIDLREGSVLVFFSAAITAIGLFSNYADFFESVSLVKKHCKLLLEQVMRVRYGSEFDISVNEQYPSLPDPEDLIPWSRMRKMFGPATRELMRIAPWFQSSDLGSAKRDGFFWFLLIMNIVLLGIVSALVGGAVLRTYFP